MEYTVSPVTQAARHTLSRIGLAYFLFFAIALGGQLLLLLLVGLVAPGFSESLPGSWLLSLFPMYGMALPVFYLLLRPLKAAVPKKRRLRPVHLLLCRPLWLQSRRLAHQSCDRGGDRGLLLCRCH